VRKNLGKKNCELSDDDIQRICDTFLAFEESEQSKIFPNAAFGYWKVTVERPLRQRVDLSEQIRSLFRRACAEADEAPLANLVDRLYANLVPGSQADYNLFLAHVEADAERHGVKLITRRLKLLQSALAQRDEAAIPVIKKVHKPGKDEADPLRGKYEVQRRVAEYEPDPELRDSEQIPLLEPGGAEAFLRREVLPYAPDARYNPESVKTGYEISFTRYFYKPQPLRTLAEIRADILALERKTEGLLDEIIGEIAS
jgi:type I restriction enzyme M protein